MSSFEEIFGYSVHMLIKNHETNISYLNFLLAEFETLLAV